MTRVGKMLRESLVKQVKNKLTGRNSAFLLSYTRVSGPQMNTLRKELKQRGADVFVSRNSIAEIALKELKFDTLAERLGGQTAFVWGDTDSVEISKALIKFIKECEGVTIVGGLLEGGVLEKNDVEILSKLPTREVLLSELLQVMQSPLTRLAGALNAKTQELLSLLNQLLTVVPQAEKSLGEQPSSTAPVLFNVSIGETGTVPASSVQFNDKRKAGAGDHKVDLKKEMPVNEKKGGS